MKPAPPRSCLNRGGQRAAPERVMAEGWRHIGVFAVRVDDARLTWPERQLIEQLGTRLYGPRDEGA